MTIERRNTTNRDGGDRVVTTACAFCDAPIAEQESLAEHLLDCEATP